MGRVDDSAHGIEALHNNDVKECKDDSDKDDNEDNEEKGKK